MKQNIEICSGCIARSVEGAGEDLGQIKKEFLHKVLELLRVQRPDVEWSLETTSCYRFCPPHRLSLVVNQKLGMTRGASIETVAEDILSRFRS